MTIDHALKTRYSKMGGNQPHVRLKLLSAKSALIHSAIPHTLKSKMLHGYQSAEKSIFGKSTTLPGESELGVSGMGTTFGQRMQLKRAGTMEASSAALDNPSPDLSQLLMSHIASSSSNIQ